MMLKNILLVGLGGFIGSIARYLSTVYIEKRIISTFPWETFTVNILGSLIMGILIGLSSKVGIVSDHTRLLFAVGFCGSFTTFSAFAYDNMLLIQQRNYLWLAYIAFSIIIGLVAVFGGQYIGKLLG